jgi:hypothetical protein
MPMKRSSHWGTASLTCITGDSPTLLHLFGGLGQESQVWPKNDDRCLECHFALYRN